MLLLYLGVKLQNAIDEAVSRKLCRAKGSVVQEPLLLLRPPGLDCLTRLQP